MGKRLNFLLRVGDPLSLLALYGFLLWRTWMRWPEPLIDFPRDLYIGWRFSEGAQLYADVLSWYGPLSHLVFGAAFKVFGVGLDTLVWVNIAVTALVAALLRAIFNLLGGRLLGWLAGVVFLCVFAFGQFGTISIFNFLTPYASQATWALGGLLLMLWALIHHAESGRRAWLFFAGVGLAIVYLDKLEPLLAAAGGLAVYCALQWVRAHRAGEFRMRSLLRGAREFAAGFLVLWLPVFVFFAVHGGLRYAEKAANQVLYTFVHNVLYGTVVVSPINRATFGSDDPVGNFLLEMQATGWLVLFCGALFVGARRWARTKRFALGWWAGIFALAAAVGLAIWQVNWINFGLALVWPTWAAALVVIFAASRSAAGRQPDFPRRAGVAAVGAAAALLFARILLRGNIYYYGFYLAPLAACFLLYLLVIELPRWAGTAERPNRVLQAAFVVLALFASLRLGGIALNNYALKTLPVGAGRDRFYTYGPEVFPGGVLLNAMIDSVRGTTPQARTLLTFPESAAVNYHLRIPCPTPALDYTPGGFALAGGIDRILADLRAHPPDVILLHPRDLHEYGAPYFGYDELSGRAIVEWMNRNYRLRGSLSHAGGPSSYTLTGNAVDLFVRVSPPAQ